MSVANDTSTANGTEVAGGSKATNGFGRHGWAGALAAAALVAALAGPSVAGFAGVASAAPYLFPDVDGAHWCVQEGWLDYVTSSGLMTGYTDGPLEGQFSPDASISRGEVVTVLYRIANPGSTATTDPANYAPTSGFPDGNYTFYWNAAIQWARDEGIVTGYMEGSQAGLFVPENPVTRAELATMVYRFAQSQGVDVSDADDSAFMATLDDPFVDDWARPAMVWAADRGIVTGVVDDDGNKWLDSRSGATRAMAAKIFTVTKRDVLECAGVFTVAFVSNGGSEVATQTVRSGEKAQRAYPVRAGYEFVDWCIDAALTRVYGFDSAVTGDLTLYAKWSPVEETTADAAAEPDAVVGLDANAALVEDEPAGVETTEAPVEDATVDEEPGVEEPANQVAFEAGVSDAGVSDAEGVGGGEANGDIGDGDVRDGDASDSDSE